DLIHRHTQSDKTHALCLLHGAHANDGKERLFVLLNQAGKDLTTPQQGRIVGKLDGQTRKLAIMHGMRLRGEDAFRLGFTDTPWESAMRASNMRGNVREHVFAALNILVEEIRGELRIQNTR